MKITTKKIIRELEKKGHSTGTYSSELIRDVRNVIDEILKQHKNITIR
jgi:nucleoid DNA-binding protein